MSLNLYSSTKTFLPADETFLRVLSAADEKFHKFRQSFRGESFVRSNKFVNFRNISEGFRQSFRGGKFAHSEVFESSEIFLKTFDKSLAEEIY